MSQLWSPPCTLRCGVSRESASGDPAGRASRTAAARQYGARECAGHDFAPPPRRDVRQWSVVTAVPAEGLRYEGRSACGCDKDPKYRPRTRAELPTSPLDSRQSGTLDVLRQSFIP